MTKCPVQKLCGGCPLLTVPYKKQGEMKRNQVISLLKQARLDIEVAPVEMAAEPAAYRNKVIVDFVKDKDKHVRAGLYAAKSHKVIPVSSCAMHPQTVNEIINEIAHLIESMKIQLWNNKNQTGLLRHVLIRWGAKTNQIMIVFITGRKEFPSRRNLVNALREKFPQITTICQSVTERDTSVVLENEVIPLYGDGFIEDILCGLKISFSAESFYQINHDQCEKLYALAKEKLDLNENDTVLDTYCGVGTIGLYLADSCKKVTGVEINEAAVKNARYNARANDINNISFIAMDSTQYMKEAQKVHYHYDAIVLDPPRAGTTGAFISAACSLTPKKICYISCDPKTQIRDLMEFKKHGYTTKTMTLVDMFPHTDHVESICLLTPSKNAPKKFEKKSPSKGFQKPKKDLNPYEKALLELKQSKKNKIR